MRRRSSSTGVGHRSSLLTSYDYRDFSLPRTRLAARKAALTNGLSLAASIRPAASTVGPAAVLVRARVTRAHQEDEKNHQKNEA